MVPTSLCCPSRSTILTGLYAHTSRLFGNGDVGGPRYGGWRRFHRLGLEKRTLGPALQAAGYRTALIGKYLNFFGKYSPPGYVPPGWDTFAAFMSSHGSYYAYHLSDGTYYGLEPQDYSTDVLASRATDFISSTPVDQPLFLYFAPFGPHAPYTPRPARPRDAGRQAHAVHGRDAAPAPAHHARLDAEPTALQPGRGRQDPAASARGADVDRRRRRVDRAVAPAGQPGPGHPVRVHVGQRLLLGRAHASSARTRPTTQSTRIPMVMRWDGHTPPACTSGRIVLNVDIARTIAAATGASMETDGLDILGAKARKGFVLEAMDGYNYRPAYCGWRTKNRMFVQWDTGEQELFDYRLDPAEAHNLAHRKSWRPVANAMRAKAYAACRPYRRTSTGERGLTRRPGAANGFVPTPGSLVTFSLLTRR